MSFIQDAEQVLRGFKAEDMRQALEAAGEIHLRIRAIELAMGNRNGVPAKTLVEDAETILAFMKAESKPT